MGHSEKADLINENEKEKKPENANEDNQPNMNGVSSLQII